MNATHIHGWKIVDEMNLDGGRVHLFAIERNGERLWTGDNGRTAHHKPLAAAMICRPNTNAAAEGN